MTKAKLQAAGVATHPTNRKLETRSIVIVLRIWGFPSRFRHCFHRFDRWRDKKRVRPSPEKAEKVKKIIQPKNKGKGKSKGVNSPKEIPESSRTAELERHISVAHVAHAPQNSSKQIPPPHPPRGSPFQFFTKWKKMKKNSKNKILLDVGKVLGLVVRKILKYTFWLFL